MSLLPTNVFVGIDASGFDRSHASKHYTKRAKLTIQQLKATLLVDTRANAIIDLHVTTTGKHDTKIAPALITRNSDEVAILPGDKGDGDQKIRTLAREEDVRPLTALVDAVSRTHHCLSHDLDRTLQPVDTEVVSFSPSDSTELFPTLVTDE